MYRGTSHVAVALVCVALAAQAARAQTLPSSLNFRLGQFALAFVPSALDSISRVRPALPPRVTVTRSVPECRMPVVVPDAAKREHMPVAPVHPEQHAMRVVPPGCVNPLGPSDTTARRQVPIP